MLTIIEKVILLQSLDVFLDIPSEQLRYLASIAEEVSYLKKDTIYKMDDPPDAMYLVLDGSVRLHRNGDEVTVAGANEAFGTWALFDEKPRMVTATAMENVRLLRISTGDFYDLIADNVQITQGIFKALVRRMHKLVEFVGFESDNT